VKVPEAMKSNPAIISSEDALTKLVHPDFVKMGAEMPRLKSMIDRTLKS
jgi:putative spermidine/putrescine transport system substrate-binding protein